MGCSRAAPSPCEACGYDLSGVPARDRTTVRCPECSHLSAPGSLRPPRPMRIALAALAPTLVLVPFVILSLLLRLWSLQGGRMGLAFVMALYCPASIGVGIATGLGEYGRPALYWRRWWHRPAIVAAVVAVNALVALTAWSLF